MNLLLINPVHPSTPHISGVRAWRFARELAGMGHRVVLLTGSKAGEDVCPHVLPLDKHDWRQPLILAPTAFAPTATGWGSGLLRKLGTSWNMLRHGGYHAAWADAAVAAVNQLYPQFAPHVIWATVGKMESAFVARRLSRSLSVPWVLDLKDNWQLFVPAPLRLAMAWRVGGWSAVTTNAGSTADDARRWHGADPRVVYSGVDEAFFRAARGCSGPVDEECFVINLVGSLYFDDKLKELLRGIDLWSRSLPLAERERVRVRYLGGDTAMFETAVRTTRLSVRTTAQGYLGIEEMAGAAGSAAVNAYVAHDGGFHHKLLELLASGRPLIAFPRESSESRAVATEFGGQLLEPEDIDGVSGALDKIHREYRRQDSVDASGAVSWRDVPYSWNAQARLLEEVLVRAART